MKANPATWILTSFLVTIIAGMSALMLPGATHSGDLSWVDAFFTATSAVCVTGLIVVDTGSYFTAFGQFIILVLIQIGGLGVMTVSVALFRWLGRTISFNERMAMRNLFAHTPTGNILQLLKSVLLLTFIAEFLGAVLLMFHWGGELPFADALWTSVFHSVSAFCNAGFALFPDSMMQYRYDMLLNVTMCSLILVGGIGFPVLHELALRFKMRKRQEMRQRMSIHTRAVLITTAALVVAGAVGFGFLEYEMLTATGSPLRAVAVSVFQSITARTAGFNTVDISALDDATLALLIFLMFVGASPGSCGGGVKTTTLALLVASTVSRIRRYRRTNMFYKTIPDETVGRAVSLIVLSVTAIGIVLFMLLLGESHRVDQFGLPHGVFLQCLFETVSAFGTVGLSMGITPELGNWGKIWIILLMILGRVGVLTFAYVIVGAGVSKNIEYSEQNVMIG